MLFSVEQAFVGRDERWALLKTSAWEANNIDDTKQNLVHHTLIVTFPLVTFLILNPTVGIMSSLNWPDWKDNIPQITILLYSRVWCPCTHIRPCVHLDLENNIFLIPWKHFYHLIRTCSGKAHHGLVYTCVPVALSLSLKIVNKQFYRIKNLKSQLDIAKYFRYWSSCFFLRLHMSFCVQFSGLLNNLIESSKNHITVVKHSSYRLIFGLFLKLKKFMVYRWSLLNYFSSKTQKFCGVIIFLSGRQ